MTKLKFFLILFIVITLTSCDDKQVFDDYQNVSDAWGMNEKISFTLPELDTTKTYNLFINIRNTNDYKYSNLFLISKMQFPNGKVVTDTLEYRFATPDGQWLGTGFSDLKENKLWYKEKVKFEEKGNYIITLQHAMRKNGEVDGVSSLEGITDVGFRIENTQNP
ncbi:gliding motility lipoprotein GldH [Aquimarina muelleri]|uniref:Gliding motility lipoprotein GldH n=1 Tax=Aquimarina muelleri TaxID=279356 RepID=A0A918N5J6_9FLAO|nr:gliding motility lipoprotein GldH [Aquimarina muelleri]MCX2763728.1 gliding motility lipoprotein GldH [Aquimarina muelleri]GGX29926.1 gliding motility lipoprotein GldH [Aquimarina muelleri]